MTNDASNRPLERWGHFPLAAFSSPPDPLIHARGILLGLLLGAAIWYAIFRLLS